MERTKNEFGDRPRPFFLPLFPYFFHLFPLYFIEKPFWATFNVVHSTILSPKLRCICLNELSVYAYVCIYADKWEKSLASPPMHPPLPLLPTTHETTNQTKTDMKTKDLTAMMAAIVQAHVKHFASDFIIDRYAITKLYNEDDEVTLDFLWMTREMGTTFCYLCELKNSMARERLLHDYSDQLPSYYVYQDGELHHISQERVKTIINEWSTPSQK